MLLTMILAKFESLWLFLIVISESVYRDNLCMVEQLKAEITAAIVKKLKKQWLENWKFHLKNELQNFVNVVTLEPVLSMHYINKYRHLKVKFLIFLQLLKLQHYIAVHKEHTSQESTYRIMACCILVVFCVRPSFGPERIQCSWGSHLYQDHLVPVLGLSILDKKIILSQLWESRMLCIGRKVREISEILF
jgi:hypothetical protein